MEANRPPFDPSQPPPPSSLPPLPSSSTSQGHYRHHHRSYSSGVGPNLDTHHDLPPPGYHAAAYPVHPHASLASPATAASWSSQPPVGWWPERSTAVQHELLRRESVGHQSMHHPDPRVHHIHKEHQKRDYPPSSPSTTTADEESDGDEWTDGRSRTARAADKVKAQRVAPPLLRSITSGQSRRTSQGNKFGRCWCGYPVQHSHSHDHMQEPEFPAMERQYGPFAGFELVFVDPLDTTVRYWWPAMVVPPSQIDRFMRLPYPGHDECLVRYFEDNKFSMVKMKDLVPFTLETEPYLHFSRNFPEFLEDKGVRKALRYLHTGILPRRFPWKAWRDMPNGDFKLVVYGCVYRIARLAHIKETDEILSSSGQDEEDEEDPDDERTKVARDDDAFSVASSIELAQRRPSLPSALSNQNEHRSLSSRALAAPSVAHSGALNRESSILDKRKQSQDGPSTISPVQRRTRGHYGGGRGGGNYGRGGTRRRIDPESQHHYNTSNAVDAAHHTTTGASTERRIPYQRPASRPIDQWDYIRIDEQQQLRNAEEREALYQSGFERLAELQAEYRQLKRTTRELAKELVGRHENGGAITRARRRKLAL
ncbi:hypothetical protein BDF19DRAFT_439708 [Syncephalis fuscata]|nr:hypothetical protein BDF19DRAFT_439708 [Syncephalis fuscata]